MHNKSNSLRQSKLRAFLCTRYRETIAQKHTTLCLLVIWDVSF